MLRPMSKKLSDCQPLIIATACLFFAGPTIVLPQYGDLFGFLAVSPVVGLLWLALAVYRRLNP